MSTNDVLAEKINVVGDAIWQELVAHSLDVQTAVLTDLFSRVLELYPRAQRLQLLDLAREAADIGCVADRVRP